MSDILAQHLDVAIAVLYPNSLRLKEYNDKFALRCLAGLDLNNKMLSLPNILPNLNLKMLTKVLGRNRKYRFSDNFNSNGMENPVDFIFSLITIKEQPYILLQGVDNPQALEMKSMVDSYDIIFKAQTDELNKEKHKTQQASDAKSQFLSRISHELRTPMNAILGFAQLQAIHLAEQSELKKHNDYIINAGFSLLELIEKMFAFVEMEDQEIELNITDCSLAHCLNQAINTCQEHANNTNISITSTTTNVHVRADEQRLVQIIKELVGNAVKFSDRDGSVSIDIQPKAPNRIEILVSDSGGNIRDDEIEQLFTPFFRSTYAKENEIPGIGIGLVLSKRIAALMNGDIHYVKNDDHSGVIFCLSLDKI